MGTVLAKAKSNKQQNAVLFLFRFALHSTQNAGVEPAIDNWPWHVVLLNESGVWFDESRALNGPSHQAVGEVQNRRGAKRKNAIASTSLKERNSAFNAEEVVEGKGKQ